MKLNQLSLFLENRPGTVRVPCRVLGEAGINILALTLAETSEYGILRLLVKDWARAKSALEQAGCVVKVTEVYAIDVPDEPGGLANLLDTFDRLKLQIEYLYAFTHDPRHAPAALIFRFDDSDQAVAALESVGIQPVPSEVLFARMGA